MTKKESKINIGDVKRDVVTSQDQSGGTTAHEVIITNVGKNSKPKWPIIISVVMLIITVLTYFGIKPSKENKMPKDEEDKITVGDVSGDVVISQNQTGGITAHSVNVGQQSRKVNAKLIIQLQQMLPDKTKTVTVTAVMGDGEAFNFATQIKDVLVEQGYDVNGVNQALYSAPIMGQEFNPDTLTLIIGTRQ